MKYLVVLVLLVPLSTFAKSEALRVSIFELLSKSSSLDKQTVTVIGYIQSNGAAYYSLYPYQVDSTLMDSSRRITIDTVSGERIDLSTCANQYVQVSGVFSVSRGPLPNVLHSVSSVMVRDTENKYMGYSPCFKKST